MRVGSAIINGSAVAGLNQPPLPAPETPFVTIRTKCGWDKNRDGVSKRASYACNFPVAVGEKPFAERADISQRQGQALTIHGVGGAAASPISVTPSR